MLLPCRRLLQRRRLAGAEPCAHHSGHCSRATHDAAVGAWAREAAEATSALEEGACDDAVLLRAAARDRAVWDAVLVRAVARVGVTNWDAVADAFARDLSGGVAEPPPNDDALPALSAAAPAAAAPLPPLPLRSPPPPPTCTAAALAARWAALRPAVRDAMKRSAESGRARMRSRLRNVPDAARVPAPRHRRHRGRCVITVR